VPEPGNPRVTPGADAGRPQPVTGDGDDRRMNRLLPPLAAVAPPGPVALNRYFGRVLMSIPDIRNSLDGLASRAEERRQEAQEMFDEAVCIEDALRDWAQKSPNGPLLPYLVFNLATLYSDIGTADARARKDEVLEWLTTAFLTTPFARMAPAAIM
jgi:hypothetical protein